MNRATTTKPKNTLVKTINNAKKTSTTINVPSINKPTTKQATTNAKPKTSSGLSTKTLTDNTLLSTKTVIMTTTTTQKTTTTTQKLKTTSIPFPDNSKPTSLYQPQSSIMTNTEQEKESKSPVGTYVGYGMVVLVSVFVVLLFVRMKSRSKNIKKYKFDSQKNNPGFAAGGPTLARSLTAANGKSHVNGSRGDPGELDIGYSRTYPSQGISLRSMDNTAGSVLPTATPMIIPAMVATTFPTTTTTTTTAAMATTTTTNTTTTTTATVLKPSICPSPVLYDPSTSPFHSHPAFQSSPTSGEVMVTEEPRGLSKSTPRDMTLQAYTPARSGSFNKRKSTFSIDSSSSSEETTTSSSTSSSYKEAIEVPNYASPPVVVDVQESSSSTSPLSPAEKEINVEEKEVEGKARMVEQNNINSKTTDNHPMTTTNTINNTTNNITNNNNTTNTNTTAFTNTTNNINTYNSNNNNNNNNNNSSSIINNSPSHTHQSNLITDINSMNTTGAIKDNNHSTCKYNLSHQANDFSKQYSVIPNTLGQSNPPDARVNRDVPLEEEEEEDLTKKLVNSLDGSIKVNSNTSSEVVPDQFLTSNTNNDINITMKEGQQPQLNEINLNDINKAILSPPTITLVPSIEIVVQECDISQKNVPITTNATTTPAMTTSTFQTLNSNQNSDTTIIVENSPLTASSTAVTPSDSSLRKNNSLSYSSPNITLTSYDLNKSKSESNISLNHRPMFSTPCLNSPTLSPYMNTQPQYPHHYHRHRHHHRHHSPPQAKRCSMEVYPAAPSASASTSSRRFSNASCCSAFSNDSSFIEMDQEYSRAIDDIVYRQEKFQHYLIQLSDIHLSPEEREKIQKKMNKLMML